MDLQLILDFLKINSGLSKDKLLKKNIEKKTGQEVIKLFSCSAYLAEPEIFPAYKC